jgi:hypothetical protein
MSITQHTTHNRHLLELAKATLVYLAIVTTFAVVTLVACGIWLLIW